MPDTDLEALAAKVKALSPPDKLRLAAGLLDQKQARLAHQIAEGVVLELGAVLAMAALDARVAERDAESAARAAAAAMPAAAPKNTGDDARRAAEERVRARRKG